MPQWSSSRCAGTVRARAGGHQTRRAGRSRPRRSSSRSRRGRGRGTGWAAPSHTSRSGCRSSAGGPRGCRRRGLGGRQQRSRVAAAIERPRPHRGGDRRRTVSIVSGGQRGERQGSERTPVWGSPYWLLYAMTRGRRRADTGDGDVETGQARGGWVREARRRGAKSSSGAQLGRCVDKEWRARPVRAGPGLPAEEGKSARPAVA